MTKNILYKRENTQIYLSTYNVKEQGAQRQESINTEFREQKSARKARTQAAQ
jgi:hypothetical protein